MIVIYFYRRQYCNTAWLLHFELYDLEIQILFSNFRSLFFFAYKYYIANEVPPFLSLHLYRKHQSYLKQHFSFQINLIFFCKNKKVSFFTMAEVVAIKEVIEITKEGIETIDKALALYNKILDQIVPWKTYEDTVKELDRFREDYSNESAKLVGEVKTLMKDAQDNYFSATQSIYEWCGLTTKLLAIYLQLFEKKTSTTYEAQKQLLLKVLEDGISKMSAGQVKLQQSSMNFNNVAGKLTTLHSRLTNEFDTKSSYFEGKVDKMRKEAYGGAAAGFIFGPFGAIIAYSIAAGVVEGKFVPELAKKLAEVKSFFEDLQKLIGKTNVDIDSTKVKLQNEIKSIGDLKVQTQDTKYLIPMDHLDELRDTILKSVNSLIAQCKEYQKRHGQKNWNIGLFIFPVWI